MKIKCKKTPYKVKLTNLIGSTVYKNISVWKFEKIVKILGEK